MSRAKTAWLARWERIGTRMVRGGEYRVAMRFVVEDPAAHAGRPIDIDLTPEMARHLADRLYRNADEADERSR